MKKFASVLLAVLVVFSMFSFVVSAAGASLTVKTDKATVKAGETVVATVSLSEGSNIGALTVDLVYDATAFKVVSLTKGATLFKGEMDMEMTNANYAAGKARYIGVAAEDLTAGGVVFTVTLEALTDAKSTISLSIDEAANDAGNIEVSTNSVVINEAEAPTEKPTEKPSETPTEPTDPTEHECEYSKYNVTKAATCKEAGVKEASCKICGNKITEAIPATGKCTAGKWEVVKAATTTSEGEKVQKCKDCGEVLQRAKIAKLSSDPITNPAIPNTDAQA